MSLHKSLVTSSKSSRKRSVFTRAERMELLKAEGRMVEGQSVYGMPKVKTMVKKAKKKEKTEAAAAAPAAAKAPAAAAKAAPAAKAAKK